MPSHEHEALTSGQPPKILSPPGHLDNEFSVC